MICCKKCADCYQEYVTLFLNLILVMDRGSCISYHYSKRACFHVCYKICQDLNCWMIFLFFIYWNAIQSWMLSLLANRKTTFPWKVHTMYALAIYYRANGSGRSTSRKLWHIHFIYQFSQYIQIWGSLCQIFQIPFSHLAMSDKWNDWQLYKDNTNYFDRATIYQGTWKHQYKCCKQNR